MWPSRKALGIPRSSDNLSFPVTLCHFLSLQDLYLFGNYACVLYAGIVVGCGGTNLNIWVLFAWVCMFLFLLSFKDFMLLVNAFS
jgi:hypothetical protein